MSISLRLATAFTIALLLTACGGEGGDSSGSSSSSTSASTVSLATPAGTPCSSSFSNTDAFGNINFISSNGNTAWGCLVVDKANSQPVYAGTQSVRFEVRPGDCEGMGCLTDRSRFDIRQAWAATTAGQIITYEYAIFIPTQPQIQPTPNRGAGSTPLTVLTQINWQCSNNNPCSSLGSDGYGALVYLKTDFTGALYLQTHQDFTWTPNQVVTVDSSPQNKWVKLKYVIKSTAASDGYLQVFVNDKLFINETRATLPNSSAADTLKVGIYNSSISSVSQPWQTQVVYFDGFSTSVTNF